MAGQSAQRSREGGESRAAVHQTPNKIWVCVAVIAIGFTIGAVAIPLHSTLLLVVGAVVFVLGCAAGWALGIMEDVH